MVSYEIYANGNERIFHFYEEGSIFLEDNLLFDRVSQNNYRTFAPTELIRINKIELASKIKEDPELALDILEASSTKFQSAMLQIKQEKNCNVTWKVCDLLLSFAEYSGVRYGNGIIIREKISQQMIANMLGSNRITTVRSMKELKDAGLINKLNENG